MSQRTTRHDTFVIERSYDAPLGFNGAPAPRRRVVQHRDDIGHAGEAPAPQLPGGCDGYDVPGLKVPA